MSASHMTDSYQQNTLTCRCPGHCQQIHLTARCKTLGMQKHSCFRLHEVRHFKAAKARGAMRMSYEVHAAMVPPVSRTHRCWPWYRNELCILSTVYEWQEHIFYFGYHKSLLRPADAAHVDHVQSQLCRLKGHCLAPVR